MNKDIWIFNFVEAHEYAGQFVFIYVFDNESQWAPIPCPRQDTPLELLNTLLEDLEATKLLVRSLSSVQEHKHNLSAWNGTFEAAVTYAASHRGKPCGSPGKKNIWMTLFQVGFQWLSSRLSKEVLSQTSDNMYR
jgi:hypothetical protein